MSDSGTATGTDRTTARLFCALDLPDHLIERISHWQAWAAAEDERLRPVRAEALHVTLAFLGDRPVVEIPRIAALVEELEQRPVGGLLRPEAVPVPRRRPRLIALEVESAEASRLQAELSEGLVTLGTLRPEQRPFWPHLTAFRLRRSDSGQRSPAGGRVQPLAAGDGHAFGFVRVALYRSTLRPQGSSYSRLAARDLPRPAAEKKR